MLAATLSKGGESNKKYVNLLINFLGGIIVKKATRLIPASVGLIVILIIVVGLIAASSSPAISAPVGNTLLSVPALSAPVLDGDGGDLAWAVAPTLDVPVAGGWAGNVTAKMQSVFAAGQLYVKVTYADPDLSLRRGPWVKNADGSWTHVKARSAAQSQYNGTAYGWSNKDPQAAYEDKFAFLWNTAGETSIDGFNENGCGVTCHWNNNGEFADGSGGFGRKFTDDNGIGDIWHFKSIRTAPVDSETSDGNGGVYLKGQIDDQYVDGCRGDVTPACKEDWGRHGDPKTAGGYSNNQNSTNTLPSHTSPAMPAPPYYILKSEETPFVDTFAAGDEVAGIRIAKMAGDRGDITSAAHYDAVAKTWTVEFTRPLVTGSDKDVQFTDVSPAAEYSFGFAVMDNAQVEHSTSGLLKLKFVDVPVLSQLLPLPVSAPSLPALPLSTKLR